MQWLLENGGGRKLLGRHGDQLVASVGVGFAF